MSSTREELIAALTGEWNRLGAELVLFSQSVAERLKINVTDLQCLAVVMSAGPMTAGQLAEATGLTTGAITGVIDRLEKARLVQREDHPTDRRRVMVRALPGDVLAATDPVVGAVFARLAAAATEQYEGYSDREVQLVIDALARAHPVLLEQVSQLRGEPSPVHHELDAPRAGATVGRLLLAPGVGEVTIDADAAMAELYRAHAEGTPPQIEADGGNVTVRARRFPLFGWGHRSLRLTLSAAIPWDIEVAQGAYRLTAELGSLRVRSLAIKGGASRLDLALGRPSGRVPLTITGGASQVTVRRPAGVPVEVRIRGGVSKTSVDGNQLGPAGGNVVWRTPGMQDGADHYAIEVVGGVSRLSVETG
ncbi:MAG TPA: MarR family transcriptional regulator [Candidatus Angelobacter sp.]|jgi:DNA-binding MarR family transcriptional regulator|nr:MarR family transcriptional regulator [Candidatus Angelobacter sp.]